jgi:putative endonuclease
MKSKIHFVYFLESLKDGGYYIGVTNCVKRRLFEHNSGLSKSTANKRPWILRKIEEYPNINLAYQRERFLKKKKSKKIIKKIINSPDVHQR